MFGLVILCNNASYFISTSFILRVKSESEKSFITFDSNSQGGMKSRAFPTEKEYTEWQVKYIKLCLK